MTLKDQFDVQGYDSTIGYVGRAFKPAKADCVLVSILKQMGAVIIAKSNLPQSIMVRCAKCAAHGDMGMQQNAEYSSGVRRRTYYGDSLLIRRIQNSRLVVLREEKLQYSRSKVALWAGEQTLEEAFAFLHI